MYQGTCDFVLASSTVTPEELLLQDRGLTSLDSLEPFKNLKKLELKGNQIASLSAWSWKR